MTTRAAQDLLVVGYVCTIESLCNPFMKVICDAAATRPRQRRVLLRKKLTALFVMGLGLTMLLATAASRGIVPAEDELDKLWEFTTTAPTSAKDRYDRLSSAAVEKYDRELKRIQAELKGTLSKLQKELISELNKHQIATTKRGDLDEALRIRSAKRAAIRSDGLVSVSLESRSAPPEMPRLTVEYRGHHYKIYDRQVAVSVAEKHCLSMGGHLVRIESKQEQAFVARHIKRYGRNEWYWIDGTDIIQEGTWLYSNNEAIKIFNWEKGEPSNVDGIEHWAAIRRSDGIWGDSRGGVRNIAYICEWDR